MHNDAFEGNDSVWLREQVDLMWARANKPSTP
jgi:hypothetical protein